MIDGKVAWELILKLMSFPMAFMAGIFLAAVAMFCLLIAPWTYWSEIKTFFTGFFKSI